MQTCTYETLPGVLMEGLSYITCKPSVALSGE